MNKAAVERQVLAQRERERLAALTTGMLGFSDEMDHAVEAGNLPVALLVALGFHAWCRRMEVSEASFERYSDREFFQRVCATASGICADAAAILPGESNTEIARLATVPEQLSCLRSLETWIRIESGMKGGWLVWNGMGAFQGAVLIVMATMVPFGVLSRVFPSVIGAGLLLSLTLGVAAMVNRANVAERLNQVTQSLVGSISPRTTRGRARENLRSCLDTAGRLGIDGSLVSCADVARAASRLVSWSESACDRLSIPRRIIDAQVRSVR
jgi:hypothetical protein